MKQKYAIVAALIAACALTACMDNTDEPAVGSNDVTCQTSVGEVNTTIAKIKTAYASKLNTKNVFERVDTNLVFEGTVVANDVSGNLYQTLVLRDIRSDGSDQCLQVGIKNTHLSPYFPLGTHVRVNVKDLYIGNYSCVPKVGQPYYTSAGNLRLGPILMECCKTNIQIVDALSGKQVEELLTPIEADASWLKQNLDINHTPSLATVEGTLEAADGDLTFAPYEEHDDGYGVNRTLKLDDGTSVTVRTSTRNEISFAVMPTGRVRVTGMLTYYGTDWQISMRDLADLEIVD